MVTIEEVSEPLPNAPWAFIAVMGVTGAGKSTFIQTASEDDSVEIGHSLVSCTSELKGYTFHHKGYNVNLIDTPGFNDTNKSETQVLKDIAEWLEDSFKGGNRLTGVIYMHNVGNRRMEGSALRNLKMFRKLCGEDPLKNVILVTSFWGKVDSDVGERNEAELRTTPEFWGSMLRKGSRTARFMADRKSALNIVESLLEKEPVPLAIQKELVEDKMPLIKTAAGQAVNEELAKMEQKYKEEKEKIRQEMADALRERDEELEQILEEQQQKLDQSLDKVYNQQEQLRATNRAEQRRMQNEYEGEIVALRQQISQVPQMNLEQAIAYLRANEAKLNPSDRNIVEAKIAEVSKPKSQKSGKKHKKSKKAAKILFHVLRVALPITTTALLGIPIKWPFQINDSETEEEVDM